MKKSPNRKICYVTGTRADFGLMELTLKAIHHHPHLDLSVLVTGMHLSKRHGYTVKEVENAGLAIAARISVDFVDKPDGAIMGKNIGKMLIGFVDALDELRPDAVLVLGDRGEMLAGALAAIHLNIPVAHVHGGERSGTVDEPVRHAISKLSHLHFVSTLQARDRLIRMGEREDCVWVTGAPGLDKLDDLASLDRHQLCAVAGFDPEQPVALFVYHPVLQHVSVVAEETRMLLDILLARGFQVLAVMPNSDAGSGDIRNVLASHDLNDNVHVVSNLGRKDFASWLAACDLMVGNSSSGIIEAATFGTPVINVGSRQNMRERNTNVVDVEADPEAFRKGLDIAQTSGNRENINIYGDGGAAGRIIQVLATHELSPSLMSKVNAY